MSQDFLLTGRKPFLGLLGLIVFFLAVASSSVMADERPLNERPMYGGIEKSAELKEADRKYINGVKAMGFTLEQGAVEAAKRGWTAMHQGDLKTAMKRFNQAWLLDKTTAPPTGAWRPSSPTAITTWNRRVIFSKEPLSFSQKTPTSEWTTGAFWVSAVGSSKCRATSKEPQNFLKAQLSRFARLLS